MSLKFSEKAHRYTLDGKPVTGVTTLLGKGLPKPALPNWAAKTVAEYVADNEATVETLRGMGRDSMVNALKGTPWKKRDDAAVRGTEIHALAEEIVHGRAVDVPEHLLPYVEGYVEFLETWGVEPLLTEVSVANRKWHYAGRPDFIGTLGGTFEGATTLLDWKTSKGVYGETALQTSAYARAEFWVPDDDPDDERELPTVERIGVVHITPEGTQVYDLGDIDAAFRLFTHVQYVAKQADTLRDLTRTPATAPTPKESAA